MGINEGTRGRVSHPFPVCLILHVYDALFRYLNYVGEWRVSFANAVIFFNYRSTLLTAPGMLLFGTTHVSSTCLQYSLGMSRRPWKQYNI